MLVSQTGKTKYASAHDMRRSFGDRWAELVMPAVLQQLTRHPSPTPELTAAQPSL